MRGGLGGVGEDVLGLVSGDAFFGRWRRGEERRWAFEGMFGWWWWECETYDVWVIL